MILDSQIIEISCIVDEFMLEFQKTMDKSYLGNPPKKKSKITISEVMNIQILFQLSSIRTFKHFYTRYAQKELHSYFPKTVSYNRFVELQKQILLPLAVFAKTCCLGDCARISF